MLRPKISFVFFQTSKSSVTSLSHVTHECAAQISRQDSVVTPVHQDSMAITVAAFTCHLLSILLSKDNVATTLMSVVKASHVVARIRTVSTPKEATSARVHVDMREIRRMAVPKFRACVQMARFVIEMLSVSMLAATDIGEIITLIK